MEQINKGIQEGIQNPSKKKMVQPWQGGIMSGKLVGVHTEGVSGERAEYRSPESKGCNE